MSLCCLCTHYRHLGRNCGSFAFECFCRNVVMLSGLHEQTNRKHKNETKKTKDVLPMANVGIITSKRVQAFGLDEREYKVSFVVGLC